MALGGKARDVTVAIESRVLAVSTGKGFTNRAGDYGFELGEDAERLGPALTVRMRERQWTK